MKNHRKTKAVRRLHRDEKALRVAELSKAFNEISKLPKKPLFEAPKSGNAEDCLAAEIATENKAHLARQKPTKRYTKVLASHPTKERLQVSIHTLALAKDCPERLVLHLLGYESVEDKGLSLLAGIAGHVAHGEWLCGKEWESALVAHYKEFSDANNLHDERRGYENMAGVFAEVARRHPIDELPFTVNPKKVEIDFVAPLGETSDGTPVDFIGVLDGLGNDKRTDEPCIIEAKFTGLQLKEFVKMFAYDMQTTGYMWAVNEVLGIPVKETWVNAIQMAKIPSSEDRTCKSNSYNHGTPYSECGHLHVQQVFEPVRRTSDQLDEFRRLALRYAERYVLPVARKVRDIGNEAMFVAPREGMLSKACQWCSYKRWCITTGRQRSMVTTLLQKKEMNSEEKKRLRSGFVEA